MAKKKISTNKKKKTIRELLREDVLPLSINTNAVAIAQMANIACDIEYILKNEATRLSKPVSDLPRNQKIFQEWVDFRLPEFLLSDVQQVLVILLNRNVPDWREITKLNETKMFLHQTQEIGTEGNSKIPVGAEMFLKHCSQDVVEKVNRVENDEITIQFYVQNFLEIAASLLMTKDIRNSNFTKAKIIDHFIAAYSEMCQYIVNSHEHPLVSNRRIQSELICFGYAWLYEHKRDWKNVDDTIHKHYESVIKKISRVDFGTKQTQNTPAVKVKRTKSKNARTK